MTACLREPGRAPVRMQLQRHWFDQCRMLGRRDPLRVFANILSNQDAPKQPLFEDGVSFICTVGRTLIFRPIKNELR